MKNIFVVLLLFCSPIVAANAAPMLSIEATLPNLTLANAEQLWRQNNRELLLSQDQATAAAADQLGAAQSPNPQLSFNSLSLDTSATRPKFGTNTAANADLVMRLDQPVERGGKRDLRMRGSALRADAARLDLSDAQRQGYIALRQAYYDVLLAQEKLKIAAENARLFGQTVTANQLRLKTGDIAPAEFSRVRVDALRADNDVRQAQNDLRQLQAALAYLLGVEDFSETIHVVDAWPGTPPAAPDFQDHIEQRPDVRAALLRVQAAEANRDLAQSLKTRDVTLSVQVERNGSNPPLHSMGVGISMPLQTGYQYQGEISRAESDLQTAHDTLKQIKAQAITDTRKIRSNLLAASERVQHFDQDLLKEAARALESAEFAYRHGALSVMDLLDARRTYRAIQMDAATAHADYAKAWSAWQFAYSEEEHP